MKSGNLDEIELPINFISAQDKFSDKELQAMNFGASKQMQILFVRLKQILESLLRTHQKTQNEGRCRILYSGIRDSKAFELFSMT